MVRAFIAWGLAPDEVPPLVSYPRALYENFWSYIWNVSLIPPLNFVLDAIPVSLLGPDRNAAWHGYLWLEFILDLAATALVFAAVRRLRAHAVIAWLVALGFSVALLPFELWRSNYNMSHYDHYTPVLASFLAFGCVGLVVNGHTWRNVLATGAAGLLLVLQMSAATYVVPAVFALIAVIDLTGCGRTGLNWRKAAVLLLWPIAGVSALLLKNVATSGIAAPSTKGGPAMMMFVQRALGYDPVAVRKLAVESGAPEWYLWAYDRPVIPPGLSPENQIAWLHLSRAFGICMPWTGNASADEQPWPFNFDQLLTQLRSSAPPEVAGWVEKDRYDSLHRHYLATGSSPELSPRWIGLYGKHSLKVGAYLFKTQPMLYLNTMRSNHDDVFWGKGPEFLVRVGRDLKTQNYRFRDALADYNGRVFSRVLRAAYIGMPVMLGLWLLWAAWRRLKGASPASALDSARLYLFLGAPVWAGAAIYSGAVAVENDRYFVHVIPYLLVGLAAMARDMGSVFSSKHFQQ